MGFLTALGRDVEIVVKAACRLAGFNPSRS
jgi:hypothetical protein